MHLRLIEPKSGFRAPTKEEKSRIILCENGEKNKRSIAPVIFGVFCIAVSILFILSCLLLSTGVERVGLLVGGLIAMALGVLLINISSKDRTKFNDNISGDFSVCDCICYEAEVGTAPDCTAGAGRVKIRTLSGAPCVAVYDNRPGEICEWFEIDAATVMHKGAVGQRMLLVRFHNNRARVFSNRMLNINS